MADNFSFQAEQAKLGAVTEFRTKVTKGVVDSWQAVHPREPLTEDAVKAQVEKLLHPDADAEGKKPKYVTYGGQKVPTAETIDEFGNAAARSVDAGTKTFGSSWIGTLLTALMALFDWISGNSGSVTESYANITTKSISTAFEKEMGELGKAGHQEFIDQQKLVDTGKGMIGSAVRQQAGLEATPDEKSFDLKSYVANAQTQGETKKADFTAVTGASKEEKIAGYINAAIKSTEATFAEPLKSLSEADRKQLDMLKTKLVENGQALATTATPEAFSEQLIKKTCKDCGIDLGADSDTKPLGSIITDMKNSKDPKQVGNAMLLDHLQGQLQAAHPFIKAAAEGVTLKPEEEKKLAQDAAKQNEASARKTAADLGTKITTDTAEQVRRGIRNFAAEEASKAATAWNGVVTARYIGTEAGVINKAKTTPPKNAREELILETAQNRAYDYAVRSGYAPDYGQISVIGRLAGEAVAETVKDPKNAVLSQEYLAQAVETNVRLRLESGRSTIDAAANANGPKIATLDAANKTNTFKQVADEIGNAIRTDANGTYKNLSTAQKTMQAHTASLGNGAAASLASTGVTGSKIDLPNGALVGAAQGTPNALKQQPHLQQQAGTVIS